MCQSIAEVSANQLFKTAFMQVDELLNFFGERLHQLFAAIVDDECHFLTSTSGSANVASIGRMLSPLTWTHHAFECSTLKVHVPQALSNCSRVRLQVIRIGSRAP